jgi:putative phosphoesterase
VKIAVLGDIHGNLEALTAAYQAAIFRQAEKIVHLGDLGGYAPFLNEVVDFIIEKGIDGVQGNYDEAVANNREHCGCKYEDPIQEEMANRAYEWTKSHASEKTRKYLKRLPMAMHISVNEKRVLLFHAAPHKNNIYWYEDRPEKFFKEMGGKTDADILIYGHTHKPYRKNIGGKVFINAGSVGKPKDGDTRACMTIVDISQRTVSVEFPRVEYDVEKTAAGIMLSGLPAYFAERLRQGV